MKSEIEAIDFGQLVAFRRHLHQYPEASGEEAQTAFAVIARLAECPPDRIISSLGGHGVAAVYDGAAPGPTVLLRAELDGLRIADLANVPHRSRVEMRGHLCGHDGHTTTLIACGEALHRNRPAKGRVILMFQPAEEDGSGAAAVIADPRYADLVPDFAFSFHNLPGIAIGVAALKSGVVNCASRGMRISLTGRTAHASMPETGVSPMRALAELMPALSTLGHSHPPAAGFRLVTVTHCRMGEPVFGIAPAAAEVFATLRTLTDDRMAALVDEAETLVRDAANRHGLALAISYQDVFVHVDNAPDAVARLESALDAIAIAYAPFDLPMRASEDFGRFGHAFAGKRPRSAMVFLGAGVDRPQLHNPDYDYPDELTPIAAKLFMRVVRDVCG
ncbi:MAG: amidohydrolase [Rhizobiaceae bacterium]|jgi:amidohydrolase|nr:amidohydrolase [Rhizobiaceae bacterium]